MPSLIPRSPKLRIALGAGASIVVIVVVALVLASLADSGSQPTRAKHVANRVGLALKIGTVAVQNAGPPATIKRPIQQAVLDSAQAYVDDAILAPLERGKLVTTYEKMFDGGVSRAATGRDFAVLTEANSGFAKKPVHATASSVHLDGLGDQTGKIALIAATFYVNIDGATSSGLYQIRRLTELTFASEHGRWVVTAYHVAVRRSIGAKTTSAVTRSGTGRTA